MKTGFKGTKGKWEVIRHSWSDTSLISGSKDIATISICDTEENEEENEEELAAEVEANFKLISKAPEMLKMLTDVKDYSDKREEIEQLIKAATE